MPADAPEVLAELGLAPGEFETVAHVVGEVRQLELDGSVAGYVWLEVRDREQHVHALVLEEAFRGRGLGGRALELLLAEHAGNVDVAELGVEPGNAAARSLYEREGFEYTGERLGFLIMRKQLGPS